MIRTQISLDRDDYALVKNEAKARGISVAEFVRQSIRQNLPSPINKADAKTLTAKPWLRYIGLVESGNPDSSLTVDEIVYGQKY